MTETTTAVKERAVHFDAEQVRAILDGTKTDHRWPIDPQPHWSEAHKSWMWRCGRGTYDMNQRREELVNIRTGKTTVREYAFPVEDWLVTHKRCPFKVGTRLWVREAFQYNGCETDPDGSESWHITYRADPQAAEHSGTGWRSSMQMPRWASRITLEVTAVKALLENDVRWVWAVTFKAVA